MTARADGSSGTGSPGVLGSARDLISGSIAALQTRLALFSADAQEAGWRLAAIIVYAIVALFFLFVGLVLLALLIIVAFWDRSPTLAVGLLSGFFLLGSAVFAWLAVGYTRARPGLFAATLQTLERDREALASRRGASGSAPVSPSGGRSAAGEGPAE